MGIQLAMRVIYGTLRLGVVSMFAHIFNLTVRDYCEDLGRFVLAKFRTTFSGVIGFFSGLFGGLFSFIIGPGKNQAQPQPQTQTA